MQKEVCDIYYTSIHFDIYMCLQFIPKTVVATNSRNAKCSVMLLHKSTNTFTLTKLQKRGKGMACMT